jgi:Arc/MetJ family transcription regulator
MPKTLIDIDAELLDLARRILGTATKKDTVNGALRDIVRRWAAVEFGELARRGIFDDLLKAEAEAEAESEAELEARSCRR